MIGRQRVLAQLRAAAEAAIGAGPGQVVLLAGEAGIGKTAVATEAAAEAMVTVIPSTLVNTHQGAWSTLTKERCLCPRHTRSGRSGGWSPR